MLIRSKNDVFQILLAVSTNREARNKYNLLFVEGRSPIEAAYRSGLEVHSIYYKEGASAGKFLPELKTNNPKTYTLTPELFSEISNMTEYSAPIVLFVRKKPAKPEISKEKNPLYLLLDRPSNPGNLGTLIRSAVAFGLDSVFIVGHACDPFDPVAISASRGAVFEIPVLSNLAVSEIEDFKKTHSESGSVLQVVATDSSSETSINDFTKTGAVLLMLGNEKLGLSKKLLELSDTYLSVPTFSARASLNIACAGSILMFAIQSKDEMARK